ncbi:protein SSUH2 homolog [Engystomops pustulosus]|uniref:protein SSUH2 homolog n=1 Tax=Engystomops pustulosus TaxID=76066 RepID=UPI003AFB78D6
MGYARCPGCGGFGYRRCLTCSGTGKLHQFLQLTVQWENHNFEFIADNKSDFPTECFKNVTGLKMFYDEQKMVSPVTHFHEPSINKASKNGISQHRAELTESKILRQRHSIEWLPLTKVNYIWKDGEYDYYVYGNENQTFAKNFPKKEHFAIM